MSTHPGFVVRQGLSPHVRGNPRNAVLQTSLVGSIPACTGKPPSECRGCWQERVYPRMYGETEEDDEILDPTAGLSPHVRGNLIELLEPFVRKRSIPACTGKPPGRRRRSRWRWVYPRMYGETLHDGRRVLRVAGLSPHVRGNHRFLCRSELLVRSIPACTGKPCG